MEVINSQIHLWAPHSDRHPWAIERKTGGLHGGSFVDHPPFTIDAALWAMLAIGVDAAICVSPGAYGFGASYAFEAARLHPGKFGVIARIDRTRPDLDEYIKTWRKQPGALGFRVLAMSDEDAASVLAGEWNEVLASAQRHHVPICTCAWDHLDVADFVMRNYPDLQLVLDHVGIAQPPVATKGPDMFHDLPHLLALAKYPNLAVKLSGAPTLSNQPFPYRDIWTPLRRIIDAFGSERLMWGTDITRVSDHTYAQGLQYIFEMDNLSDSERENILGKSLRRVFAWPAARKAA